MASRVLRGLGREWFTITQQFRDVCLQPHFPLFFSQLKWGVYDRQPCRRGNLLQLLVLARGDVDAKAGSGTPEPPCCAVRENIAWAVDKVLWPEAEQRRDAEAE